MKLKKIICIIVATLVLSAMSVTAFADNNVNESLVDKDNSIIVDKETNSNGDISIPSNEILESNDFQTPVMKGSLKISLSDIDKGSKEGVKFSISKVADIVDGKYEMLDKYKSSKVELNDLKNSNDLDIAANMLKKVAETDKTLVTNSNGECSIDNLNVGVYLVYASDISNYENITPFLVSIPTFNNTNKTMSYDVKVMPKHTPLPKKIEKSKAPSTGFSGGEVFGALSLASLTGVGLLVFSKRKAKH